LRAIVVVVLALRVTAASAAESVPLRVYAAASLAEVLPRVAAAWTGQGNPPVTFAFDASSRLARQIEAGAPADVFVSADTAWIEFVVERGLVRRSTRVDLAGNRLVVVVPATDASPMSGPEALARPSIRHLALAGENVPAGIYAYAALTHLGLWATLAPRVVRGDNVRTALAWVATGEADAGIVYATDARVEPRVRVAWPMPEGSHPPIRYLAAVTTGSARPDEAASLLAFCRGEVGLRRFEDAGFTRPVAP
jgi:molybdate transport system substrate-binding protein